MRTRKYAVNFPRWIRSEVTILDPSDADADEICRRIARRLEKRGATSIEAREGKIHFRAERAMGNLNPLTSCSKGSFRVDKINGNIRVRYEIDQLYLLLWTSVLTVFLCIFGLAALLKGSVIPLVLFSALLVITIPLNYAFDVWGAKSLFMKAAMPDIKP